MFVQLTLGQHELEMHGSTYMWVILSVQSALCFSTVESKVSTLYVECQPHLGWVPRPLCCSRFNCT